MHTLYHGIKLALMTNRTLIIPPVSPEYSPLGYLLDIEILVKKMGWCILSRLPNNSESSMDFFHASNTSSLHRWSTSDRPGDKDLELLHFFNLTTATIVVVPAGDLYSFSRKEPSINHDKSNTYDIWPLNFTLQMHPLLLKYASAVQREQFADHYVSVHLRSMEGSCHSRLAKLGHAAEDMCDLTPEVVKSLAAKTLNRTNSVPLTKHECWFMASDHEDKKRDARFVVAGFKSATLHSHVTRPVNINLVTLAYMVDIYIMLNADIHVDNAASSLPDLLLLLNPYLVIIKHF